ncbi:MAG: hypothetical protein M3P53_00795 [Actinomycetota bacterium]|nr:hypothetical protein [Actinomycetota bacterium]
MSAVDLAALVLTIAGVSAVVLLVVGLRMLSRTLATLRAGIDRLSADTRPAIAELQRAAAELRAEQRRLDDAVSALRSVSGTVDAASRLAYTAFSNPVIKAMSIGAGTARAARAIRQR